MIFKKKKFCKKITLVLLSNNLKKVVVAHQYIWIKFHIELKFLKKIFIMKF